MRSLATLMDLTGRKALITGGAGHIGFAAGEALAELGATVAILDVDQAAVDKRAAELGRIRPDCARAILSDLGDEQSTRASVRRVIKELDGLDIVIHSAGLVGTTQVSGWAMPFEQQT